MPVPAFNPRLRTDGQRRPAPATGDRAPSAARFNAAMRYRLDQQDAATREALIALGSVLLRLRASRGATQRAMARRWRGRRGAT